MKLVKNCYKVNSAGGIMSIIRRWGQLIVFRPVFVHRHKPLALFRDQLVYIVLQCPETLLTREKIRP